ncbi:hypothetical protein [Ramlibacter sp.]|uniref:hypothetical protein n=1 Tax=Ramlibacter sp. TaxID=1917967 RepID=UPI002628BFA8|nr:hypothetical protein [Ramlibacter sp.]MDB5957516.1 hypothetical protein [Ramlibacter sp.]
MNSFTYEDSLTVRSRRASVSLPARIAKAANRKAHALAHAAYPSYQAELQALAWDLLQSGVPEGEVLNVLACYEDRRRGCDAPG